MKISLSDVLQAVESDEYIGFCLSCGSTQSAEPDARRHECDDCGERKVYGAEEILISCGA